MDSVLISVWKTLKFGNVARLLWQDFARLLSSRGSRGPQVPWWGQGAVPLVGVQGAKPPQAPGIFINLEVEIVFFFNNNACEAYMLVTVIVYVK